MNGCKRRRRMVRLLDPQWTGSIEGWTRTVATANEWRTLPERDADDLVQEGFLLFHKCVRMYVLKPRTGKQRVIDAPHFMALYQRTFLNKIATMANHRTKRNTVTTEFDEEIPNDRPVFAEADFRLLLAHAPSPRIQLLVWNMLNDQSGELSVHRRHKDGGGARETTNEWLRRLAGYRELKRDEVGPAYDIAGRIKQWLKGAES